MIGRLRTSLCAAAVMVGLAMPAAAQVQIAEESPDPSFLSASVGVFGIRKENDRAGEVLLQYRSDQKWWIFKPHAGVMATTDGSFYGFGGLLVDIYFGRRFVVTPTTAVGAYFEGDGKDLGNVLEFRSGLELGYRFDDRSRLGIGAYHMSNASTGSTNPGAEMITISYSVPIERIFGK